MCLINQFSIPVSCIEYTIDNPANPGFIELLSIIAIKHAKVTTQVPFFNKVR